VSVLKSCFNEEGRAYAPRGIGTMRASEAARPA